MFSIKRETLKRILNLSNLLFHEIPRGKMSNEMEIKVIHIFDEISKMLGRSRFVILLSKRQCKLC